MPGRLFFNHSYLRHKFHRFSQIHADLKYCHQGTKARREIRDREMGLVRYV